MSDTQSLDAPKTIPEIELSPLQAAHAAMIQELRDEGPTFHILGLADSRDVEDRAEHAETVLAIVIKYLRTVAADTAENAPLGKAQGVRDAIKILECAAADYIGDTAFAAAHMEG